LAKIETWENHMTKHAKREHSLGVVEVPAESCGVLKPSARSSIQIGSDLIPAK